MNIPCDQSIRCDLTTQGLFGDSPIANFSSERPDAENFIGYNPGWDENVPPLGTIWDTPGCISWCISHISQQDADLCAAAQQLLCITNNDPTVPPEDDGSSDPDQPYVPPQGNGGDVPPGQPPVVPPNNPPHDGPDNPTPVFPNTPQTCTITCPDGTTSTETVAFGQVVAQSQVLADRMAYSIACQRAQAKADCTSCNIFRCLSPTVEYNAQLPTTDPHPPVTFSVAGGSLPTGLVLESTGRLHGFMTVPGNYDFTVQTTNAIGGTSTKQCHFRIFGLSGATILPDGSAMFPDASACEDYNYQLQTEGGHGAVTFDFDIINAPAWIDISPAGTVTGKPGFSDANKTFGFDISMTDSDGHTCFQRVEVFVGPYSAPCFDNGTLPIADTSPGAPNYSAQLVPHQPAETVYGYILLAGAFPAGISLNPITGEISGNAAGAADATYHVTIGLTGVCWPCEQDFDLLAQCHGDTPETVNDVTLTTSATGSFVNDRYFCQRTGVLQTLTGGTSGSCTTSDTFGMQALWQLIRASDMSLLFQGGISYGPGGPHACNPNSANSGPTVCPVSIVSCELYILRCRLDVATFGGETNPLGCTNTINFTFTLV